ncbi:hypothetical protein F2Q70_00003155 [Brassica cretica]|uniref:Uncharacterized protein n=1 Tax=Brassica cretica TaxID=69181 RepID=A0A8S9J6A0_BRACR|nr:hypothetical protein F2Q70_00003155 [Brassica cretica]
MRVGYTPPSVATFGIRTCNRLGLVLATEYGFLAGWRKKLHALVVKRGDHPHLVQPGAPYDGIEGHRLIDYGEFCFQLQIVSFGG